MLFGELPKSEDTSLIDRDLVLHADHGINASAFTARVAASTRTDIHAAITAGVAALKGPIHGGAAEGVMKMAQAIGEQGPGTGLRQGASQPGQAGHGLRPPRIQGPGPPVRSP